MSRLCEGRARPSRQESPHHLSQRRIWLRHSPPGSRRFRQTPTRTPPGNTQPAIQGREGTEGTREKADLRQGASTTIGNSGSPPTSKSQEPVRPAGKPSRTGSALMTVPSFPRFYSDASDILNRVFLRCPKTAFPDGGMGGISAIPSHTSSGHFLVPSTCRFQNIPPIPPTMIPNSTITGITQTESPLSEAS